MILINQTVCGVRTVKGVARGGPGVPVFPPF